MNENGWHADAPPTVEQVGDAQKCLATESDGKVRALTGECVRDFWKERVAAVISTIAWAYMPKPYQPPEPYQPPTTWQPMTRLPVKDDADQWEDVAVETHGYGLLLVKWQAVQGNQYRRWIPTAALINSCREPEPAPEPPRFQVGDWVRILDGPDACSVVKIEADGTFDEPLFVVRFSSEVKRLYRQSRLQPWQPQPGEKVRIVGPSITGGIAYSGNLCKVRGAFKTEAALANQCTYPLSSLEPAE